MKIGGGEEEVEMVFTLEGNDGRWVVEKAMRGQEKKYISRR